MIASLKIPLLKRELKSFQSRKSFLACMVSQMYFFAVEWSGKAENCGVHSLNATRSISSSSFPAPLSRSNQIPLTYASISLIDTSNASFFLFFFTGDLDTLVLV